MHGTTSSSSSQAGSPALNLYHHAIGDLGTYDDGGGHLLKKHRVLRVDAVARTLLSMDDLFVSKAGKLLR